MSLSIYLEAAATCPNPCEHCSYTRAEDWALFDANITHNLKPMWREAGCLEALYESGGKRASEIEPDVAKALDAMQRDPARFEKHNAPNGWGLYENAVPWLRRLLKALRDYPDAIVRVSR